MKLLRYREAQRAEAIPRRALYLEEWESIEEAAKKAGKELAGGEGETKSLSKNRVQRGGFQPGVQGLICR